MHAHTDRDQFAPPRPPARLRAITLASSKAFGIPLAGQKRGTVIEAAE